MAAQLGLDGLVVPLATADEILDVFAVHAGVVADRFGGLALQAAEQTADNHGGVVALLLPIEPGQVALEEAGQAIATAADRLGGEGSIVEQRLSVGMVEQRHGQISFGTESTLIVTSVARLC
jgi:hypothetical protein